MNQFVPQSINFINFQKLNLMIPKRRKSTDASISVQNAVTSTKQTIKNIEAECIRQIQFSKFLKTGITTYCGIKSFEFIDRIEKQDKRSYQVANKQIQQNQPRSIPPDNLIPVSINISDNNKSEKNIKSAMIKKTRNNNLNSLRVSKRSTLNTVQAKSKLQFSQIQSKKDDRFQSLNEKVEEDQFLIKQIRKQFEAKTEKQRQQEQEKRKKQRQEIQKLQMSKNKRKKKKEDLLGFDYNGGAVKIKKQNRDHLIDSGMQGKMLLKVNKLNQANKDIKQTNVEYTRKKKINPQFQKSQIEFTNIRSLYNNDIEPSKGSKLIEGPFVIEDKVKKIPTIDLLNSLNTRRLTREEYKRVKQMTGGQTKNQDLTKSRNQSKLLQQKRMEQKQSVMERIRSQKVLSKNNFAHISTITVNNSELLQNLISGPINNVLEQRIVRRKESMSEEFNPEKSETLDSFSKEVIKLGTLERRSKSVSNIMDSVKFPKIHLPRSVLQIPKYRSKIKDGSDLRRKIRIRFEDKLRH